MTIRNKIEDMKVVPMYLRTSEMIADIGTKALDPPEALHLSAGQTLWILGGVKDKCNSQGGRRPCGSLPLAARHALQRPKPWGRSPQSRAGSPEGLCRLQPTDYHPQRSLQMWMTRSMKDRRRKKENRTRLSLVKSFFLSQVEKCEMSGSKSKTMIRIDLF